MIKNKTTENLLKEIIDFGLEIEMIYNEASKFGGFNKIYDERKKIPGIREKARRRVYELSNRGIDVFTYEYTYIDENGYDFELNYSTQFIGRG